MFCGYNLVISKKNKLLTATSKLNQYKVKKIICTNFIVNIALIIDMSRTMYYKVLYDYLFIVFYSISPAILVILNNLLNKDDKWLIF